MADDGLERGYVGEVYERGENVKETVFVFVFFLYRGPIIIRPTQWAPVRPVRE